MAIRAAIAIGPDAVVFAIDRVRVAHFVHWLLSLNAEVNSIDDPKWRKPFNECVWWQKREVLEIVNSKIKAWGLESHVAP